MADGVISEFERMAYRAVVTYAAGHKIFCPDCERIMDCRTTVVVTQRTTGKTIVTCTQCWGKSPMLITEGPIEVLDGRVLWAKPKRKAKGKRGV